MSKPRKSVAITGMGAVAAPHLGSAGLWRALLHGRSGITLLDEPLASEIRSPVAAQITGFDPPADFRTTDLFTQFALAAAAEAVDQSELASIVAGPRTAVVMGTGIGGESTHEAESRRLYLEGARRVDPFTIPKLIPSAAASRIAMEYNVTGSVFAVTSACSSATHAIGLAFHMIRAGIVDRALAGGSEACLTLGTLKAWDALRVLAPDFCRPFSFGRKGLVLGEGAGVLVLECLDQAEARGATIVAELAGFGWAYPDLVDG